MASAGASKSSIFEAVKSNDESMTLVDVGHLTMSSTDYTTLGEALKQNTVVTELKIVNLGMKDADSKIFAEVIQATNTLEKVDLGYNKIGPSGMKLIAEALKDNSSITECKLHRQDKDMGSAVEDVVAKIWETNTTLQRLYITLHDRRCNQANTAGEVRNKSIAACIKAGKNWDHLDPTKQEEQKEKRRQAAEEKKKAEELARKPISEKVESTGGPYTLKQLTCAAEFRPDDIDPKNRQLSLADDVFEELFKMSKDDFGALAKWKQLNLKKKHNLH